MEVSIKKIIKEEMRDVIRAEMVAMEQRLIKIIDQKLKEKIIPVTTKLIEVIQELNQKVEQWEQIIPCLEKRVKELREENEKIKENFNLLEGQMDLIQTKQIQRFKEMEEENEKMKENFNALEGQMNLIQINQMQKVLRLRGIKEEKGESLKDVSSRILAQLIKAQPLDIYAQIEKIYRVNSQMALQNNWPRDIVIYLTDKGLKDRIVQASYNQEIQWQNHRVRVFKEIPSRILLYRKNYFFLINELRNRQIRYKWEFSQGLSLIYEGKKYFLNTIQKAKDFYKDVLASGILIRPEQSQEESVMEVVKEQKILPDVTEKEKKMVSPSPGSGKNKRAKNRAIRK